LWVKELATKGSEDLKAALRAEFQKRQRDKPKRTQPDKTAPGGKSRKPEQTVDFRTAYQRWYSQALAVIEQLLPERYDEFRDLYRPEKRKEIDVTTYGIADYLAGVRVTRGAMSVRCSTPCRSGWESWSSRSRFSRPLSLVSTPY
jgi:hypothetical protein